MSEPRLNIRSAKARNLVLQVSKRDGCSIKDAVESALNYYAEAQYLDHKEDDPEFWQRFRIEFFPELR